MCGETLSLKTIDLGSDFQSIGFPFFRLLVKTETRWRVWVGGCVGVGVWASSLHPNHTPTATATPTHTHPTLTQMSSIKSLQSLTILSIEYIFSSYLSRFSSCESVVSQCKWRSFCCFSTIFSQSKISLVFLVSLNEFLHSSKLKRVSRSHELGVVRNFIVRSIQYACFMDPVQPVIVITIKKVLQP